jgi:hypothetical protein
LDEYDELLVGRDSEGHDKATYIAGNNISIYGKKTVDFWFRNKVNVLNNLTRIYSSVSIVAILMIESGDGRQFGNLVKNNRHCQRKCVKSAKLFL